MHCATCLELGPIAGHRAGSVITATYPRIPVSVRVCTDAAVKARKDSDPLSEPGPAGAGNASGRRLSPPPRGRGLCGPSLYHRAPRS